LGEWAAAIVVELHGAASEQKPYQTIRASNQSISGVEEKKFERFGAGFSRK
jgi:hypothetical protein